MRIELRIFPNWRNENSVKVGLLDGMKKKKWMFDM